jgi:tetratricopeptide (TPR) repeat protein
LRANENEEAIAAIDVCAGSLSFTQGRLDDATRAYEHALEVYRRRGRRIQAARVLAHLASVSHQAGRLEEAAQRSSSALETYRALDAQLDRSHVLQGLALVSIDRGRCAEARTILDEAAACSEALADRSTPALLLAFRAESFHAEGRLDVALDHYRRAAVALAAVGMHRYELLCIGAAGIVEFALARPDAVATLTRVVAGLGEVHDEHYRAFFLSWLGVAQATLDRIEEARRSFEEAARALDESAGPHQASERLNRAHLELACARLADRRGDDVSAENHREHARAARASMDADLAARSLDVRRAAAVLDRALALDAESALPAIVVDADGRWFQVPDGARVPCGKRQAIRLLLVELARQRLRAPGIALPAHALIEAGWVDERIDESAAMNRLYVSLNRLRKLGLEALLRRSDEGWFLDPACTVRWSRDETSE